MDTATFYATASALSFTLLGFWWVVVQFRHDELTADPALRRFAFVVSLYFILPGLMSLGALLTGDLPLIWRLTFATAGTVGMVAVVLGARALSGPYGMGSSVGRWMWLGLPLFALLTFVALRPDLVRSTLALEPLQVEGATMTLLVFLGISFAWLLFTEPRAPGATGDQGGSDGSSDRGAARVIRYAAPTQEEAQRAFAADRERVRPFGYIAGRSWWDPGEAQPTIVAEYRQGVAPGSMRPRGLSAAIVTAGIILAGLVLLAVSSPTAAPSTTPKPAASIAPVAAPSPSAEL